MDKFDFMSIVADVLDKCESEKEIEQRIREMTDVIKTQERLHKAYLKLK